KIMLKKKYEPCHALVIRDLRNYHENKSKTSLEARAMNKWYAGRLKDLLVHGCQLHGLYFLKVGPQFTSRQDSRTASPGVVCKELSVKDFLHAGRSSHHNLLRHALRRVAKGSGSPIQRYLVALYSHWDPLKRTWTDAKGQWILSTDRRWASLNRQP